MQYYIKNMPLIYKEDLFDTNLPILIIDKNKIDREYNKIGEGGEGSVYAFNQDIVLKDFLILEYCLGEIPNKYRKIEELGKLKDESFCFPKGLFGYEDYKKEGYYTKRVIPHSEYKDFNCIREGFGNEKIFTAIIKADEAMQRAHKMGIVIGDIREENIMIDENFNPIFVDTDNYKYHGYDFDLPDPNTEWLRNTFHKKFSTYENDKYIYAMMAMKYVIPELPLWIRQSDDFFKELISRLDVSMEIKEGLRLIFSSSNHKPYVSEVFKKMNPKKRILSKNDIDYLKHY